MTDSESGLVKLGIRFYDAALGSFTQVDPTGLDEHAYAYASANPISLNDPTGAAPGCNNPSPTRYGRADFTPICNNHDACYSHWSTQSRLDCDKNFHRSLQRECRRAYGWAELSRYDCLVVTDLMFNGVRIGGKRAYKGRGSKF